MKFPKVLATCVAAVILFATASAQDLNSAALHACGFQVIQVPRALSGSTLATGINDKSTIVGDYEDTDFKGHGFIFSNSQFQTIDFPSGVNTHLRNINDRGQILGTVDSTPTNENPQSFVLENGKFTILNFPDTPSNFITAFNDFNEFSGTDLGSGAQGFVIVDGQRTNLPDMNGSRFFPAALNDRGVVLGGVEGQNSPVLLRYGQFLVLPNAPGASFTSGLSINDLNEIVGRAATNGPSEPAFFYANGSFTLFSFPGADTSEGIAVNNRKQVVGRSFAGFQQLATSWVTQLCSSQ